MTQYIHNGDDDGALFGRSTEKIAFYGATPATQPASASQAAVTATLVTTVAATAVTAVATTAATATTTTYGFTTSTQADDIVARVNQLVTDVGAFDGKINQAVADVGDLTTLVNQLRANLVTLGLIKGAA